MPRLLALFLLLPSLCFAGDWTREDTYRQSALTVLLIADWAQTRWFIKNPQQCNHGITANARESVCISHAESNPILGEHPSISKVNNFMAASIIGHVLIAYALPSGWRDGWQYVWIGIEADAVHHNHSVGIKMEF